MKTEEKNNKMQETFDNSDNLENLESFENIEKSPLYETAVLLKSALPQEKEYDVEAEWQAFKAKRIDAKKPILKFRPRKWAAAVILTLSFAALAATIAYRTSQKAEEKAEERIETKETATNLKKIENVENLENVENVAEEAFKPQKADTAVVLKESAPIAEKKINAKKKGLVELFFDLKPGSYSVSVCDADVVPFDSLQPNAMTVLSKNLTASNPTKDLKFSPETTQTISGHVERTLNKSPKNMTLLLLSPADGGLKKFMLGKNNCFRIENLDFTDGTSFTVQAETQSGSTSMVQIYIDEETFPKITPLRAQHSPEPSSRFMEQERKQKSVNDMQNMILLDEIEVKGRRVFNRQKIQPDRILAEGDYWLEHSPNTTFALRRMHLFGIPLHIFIDDFEADREEFLNLPINTVRQMEYFFPESGMGAYYGLTFNTPVLLVFTKPARQLKNTLSFKNITPLGYARPARFHAPQYPAENKDEYTAPDFRTTLYWNPALTVGRDCKAAIRFYNSDTAHRFLVTIEGIANDGTIVSETKIME